MVKIGNCEQNIVTWKIPYSCKNDLSYLIKEYNILAKYTYNRIIENNSISTKELTLKQKGINGIGNLGSHLKNSAIHDMKSLKSKGKVIFGGRSLFIQRCQRKIRSKEFREKRLIPLCSVGEANKKANRLFQIADKNRIIFKLNRDRHYTLFINLLGKKRSKELKKLIALQNDSKISITYKLSKSHIYLTFDYNTLNEIRNYNLIKSRVMAIDMNPNSLGYTIVDFKSETKYKIIEAGSISIKDLNEYENSLPFNSDSDISKFLKRKRDSQTLLIAERLAKICKHYLCEVFAIENLKLKPKDLSRGKRVNRLINNQWNRNKFVSHLKKLIKNTNIEFIEVAAQYSSYVGNLVYRDERLPDECLSSIEIGRRGYEFSGQYLFKRLPKKKNIILPNIEELKNRLAVSLEEIGIDVHSLDNWIRLCSEVKKSNKRYRFSLEDAITMCTRSLFIKNYYNRYTSIYRFI